MKPSPAAIALIKSFEDFKACPYYDTGRPPVPTIGYGTTVYPDGRKVRTERPPH